MSQFICGKCDKYFASQSHFDRHVKRKFSCTRSKLFKCDKCKKTFKHYSSMNHHKNHRCCEKSVVNNQQINIENQINNNNNLNVDGDVKVVKFGSENLSYISDDLYKHILGRGFRAVGEFIGHSHFNPAHPENHNIYIANLRDDYIILYDGDKWIVSGRDEVMEDIIYAKSDFLFNKFKQLRGGMPQEDIDRFIKFMNERDDDQTLNRLKSDIKLQLYNNRYDTQNLRRRMEADKKFITNPGIIEDVIKSLSSITKDKLDKLQKLLNSL